MTKRSADRLRSVCKERRPNVKSLPLSAVRSRTLAPLLYCAAVVALLARQIGADF